MITGAKQSCTVVTAVCSCRLRTGRSVRLGCRTAIPDDVVRTCSGDPTAQQARQIVDPCSLVVSAAHLDGRGETGCASASTSRAGGQMWANGSPARVAASRAATVVRPVPPVSEQTSTRCPRGQCFNASRSYGVAVPRRPRRRHHHPTGADSVRCLGQWPAAGQLDRRPARRRTRLSLCRAVLHHRRAPAVAARNSTDNHSYSTWSDRITWVWATCGQIRGVKPVEGVPC